MYIWNKETTPGTTGARCTIRDGSGLFVAECIASDAAAIVEAPAMLAALRKAQELLRDLEAPAHLDEGAALDDEMTAILARIDGTPTARAGVWRIITGTHCAEWLYWSNASGWGSLAQSDGFPQAERKTVNLPIGGQWWFDDEGEPDPTAQPIEGEG